MIKACAVTIGLMLFVAGGHTQPGSPDGLTYKVGYSAIMKLGLDLQKALKPQNRSVISQQPISLTTDMMPYIKIMEYPDETQPIRGVWISAGFVDLMNQVAHAKAIDRIQKGYFEKFILALAKETGEKELKELPNLSDKRYWTDDMMNEQLSNFNQMVGIVVAIELSHHYLGHFKKYSSQLAETNNFQPPINNLLTPEEYAASLKAGALNALECGFGVEGVKALYDTIGKMPQRPVWTDYFLPKIVKVDKVKKDLQTLEKKFFAGKTD